MNAKLEELEKKLISLDKKSYRTLKGIQGSYTGSRQLQLHIDYVQGDPFAAPSRIRLEIPLKQTGLNKNHFHSNHRKKALKHFFTKEFETTRRQKNISIGGTGKSGLIMIDTPGPEILDRGSVSISEKSIEFRISCGIPASGRQVLGKKASELLCSILPSLAVQTIENYNSSALEKALVLADDQQLIREKLKKDGRLAFVANGAVLPRESGASHRPLKHAVPFQAPSEWQQSFDLSNGETISGMVIDQGVTLIVGGGYHGKSTLLQALEAGVYDHESADGREFVITDDSAVKIRAEDKRSVTNVNISPFINELPMKKSTHDFYSEDASGSTSQAANIIEALEAGASSLLIDEDTSATNFMIRDARMQNLVSKEKEPITPFVDRVKDLHLEHGISTVLVLGGSGDYFEAADRVIMMDEYVPFNKTKEAKALAASMGTERSKETGADFTKNDERKFPYNAVSKKLDKKAKVQNRGLSVIQIGKHTLDLHAVEQLVSSSQTEAAAMMLKKLHGQKSDMSIPELVDSLYQKIEQYGVDYISPYYGKHPGNIALPRKYEMIAAINRIRP